MKEQDIFVKSLKNWLPEHNNEWVWINRDEVSFHTTYEEAISSAHAKGYTKGPVFIEEIIDGYQIRMFPGRVFA